MKKELLESYEKQLKFALANMEEAMEDQSSAEYSYWNDVHNALLSSISMLK